MIIDLTSEQWKVILHSLGIEMDYQAREQKRVRYQGTVWYGRARTIDSCQEIAKMIRETVDNAG